MHYSMIGYTPLRTHATSVKSIYYHLYYLLYPESVISISTSQHYSVQLNSEFESETVIILFMRLGQDTELMMLIQALIPPG